MKIFDELQKDHKTQKEKLGTEYRKMMDEQEKS